MRENPFSLPQREDPDRALDPLGLDGEEGLNLYVPVDNTETAFEQFERSFPKPRELTRRGQLIVAMGRSGCGKSALINRCAYRAMKLVEQADGENGKLQVSVIDARGRTSASDRSEKRVPAVAEHVRDCLESEQLLKVPTERQKERLAEDASRIYALLENLLVRRDVVVIVLLPRVELVEDLEAYAALSHPNVVFFAELNGGYPADLIQSRLDMAERHAAIVMKVGLMDDRHGWDFVQKRYDGSNYPREKPRLARATVRRMIGSRLQPIREFQRTLYLLHQEVNKKPNHPRVINFNHVRDVFYWSSGPQQGADE
jgi:hypothetical protein